MRGDDRSRVFVGRLDGDRRVAFIVDAHLVPAGNLVFAAAGKFIERHVEALDQVVAPFLNQPGRVFGEVLARFGDEIAEPLQHLVAEPVVVRHAAIGR